MKVKLNNILQFFLFLIAQVIVNSYVNFGPYFFICIYPLFILSLPSKMPSIVILGLSFLMGMGIDILTNSIWGLNAAAAVLLGYMQPFLLKMIFSKGEIENQIRPSLADLGLPRFTLYIVLGLTIHNLFFSLLENFGTPFIFDNIIRMLVSIVINTLLILLIEFGIFYKNYR